MGTKYERIRMGGKTFFARIISESELLLYFVKVDKEGEDLEVKKNAEGKWVHTEHLADKTLVTRRTPMKMSLIYAELEPA